MSIFLLVELKSKLTSNEDTLRYYLTDYWTKWGDPRVRDFPFFEGGPWKLVALLFLYLYFIAIIWSKYTKRLPERKYTFVVLFNGSQLGLNGAWFVIGFFTTPYGQTLLHPTPDDKTADFFDLLRVYFCCSFLLFKLSQIALNVVIISLTKSRIISSLDLIENVSMPLIIYFCVKFMFFEMVVAMSLVNTVVCFVNCCYFTLCSANLQIYPNGFWEKCILAVKMLQYVIYYFVGGYHLLWGKSLSSPLVKMCTILYSGLLYSTVWSKFSNMLLKPEIRY